MSDLLEDGWTHRDRMGMIENLDKKWIRELNAKNDMKIAELSAIVAREPNDTIKKKVLEWELDIRKRKFKFLPDEHMKNREFNFEEIDADEDDEEYYTETSRFVNVNDEKRIINELINLTNIMARDKNRNFTADLFYNEKKEKKLRINEVFTF